jgi:type VI secretion system protein ImpM
VPVASLNAAAAASGGVLAGFYGKIPARGDFVRDGLPRDFVRPWDAWQQLVIAGSRARLGEAWLEAFLEAPVWRFALPATTCGPDPVPGVWMPGVGRAGRYFPPTLAAVFPGGTLADLVELRAGWLTQAEAAGRAAVEHDVEPAAIREQLAEAQSVDAAPISLPADLGASLWWTEGAPRVPAATRALHGLPDLEMFIMMLDAAGAPSRAAEG